jgi:nitrite reductase/ring-hydroxylating ferredoxin subunit
VKVRACRVEEIPPGGSKVIPHGKFGIGLFNRDDTIYALMNRCPHDGAPICLGPVTGTTVSNASYDASWVEEGHILRCPWHGWEFDLRDGQTVVEPRRSIKTYDVVVEDGWVYVDA